MRRARGLIMAAALALVGCADDAGNGYGYQSGTRLRARWMAADGGPRQFQGWYDAERDEDCAFEVIPGEGDAYCYPSLRPTTGYADDACSQPVHAVPVGTDPARYVATWRAGCPEEVTSVLVVGARLDRALPICDRDDLGI